MGSVSPLLAIAAEAQRTDPSSKSFFIGTHTGPEQEVVEAAGIAFFAIRSGRLRRYIDVKNVLDPFRAVAGVGDSVKILREQKPDVMVSAGGFVSVPVAIACWMLRIPVVIHQQDIIPGLANKIMASIAKKISVSFKESCHKFSLKKTVWCGNPVRDSIRNGDKARAIELFSLEKDVPVVSIFGGGTGALSINKLIVEALPELLSFCQVIHSAGKGKNVFQDRDLQEMHTPEPITATSSENPYERYHVLEFISADEVRDVYAASDLVVTRSGLSALSELSVLGKPTVTIPIPKSHQEANAGYFEKRHAVVTLNEQTLTPQILATTVRELLQSIGKRETLSKNIQSINRPDAAERILGVINSVVS